MSFVLKVEGWKPKVNIQLQPEGWHLRVIFVKQMTKEDKEEQNKKNDNKVIMFKKPSAIIESSCSTYTNSFDEALPMMIKHFDLEATKLQEYAKRQKLNDDDDLDDTNHYIY
jgi:hypothetical protein